MKNLLVILFVVFMAGCGPTNQRLETIVDDPGTILQDPGFASYQQKLDDLEKQSLDKKITYAEYLEQKKKIEEDYAKEVQQHRNTVEGSEVFGGHQ